MPANRKKNLLYLPFLVKKSRCLYVLMYLSRSVRIFLCEYTYGGVFEAVRIRASVVCLSLIIIVVL